MNPVGICELEEPLSSWLGLDRGRDVDTLPPQPRVLLFDVVDYEDDRQPDSMPLAHAVGLEAL
jgi:hypothetical protein